MFCTFWPHVPQTCIESFHEKLLPCSIVCPRVKWMSIPHTCSTPLLYPGGLGNKCLHSGGPFLTTGSKTQPTNPVFRNGNFETGIRILIITWTPLLVWNATRPAHKLLREISQPRADPVYIDIDSPPVMRQPDSGSWPPVTGLRVHTHWTRHTR